MDNDILKELQDWHDRLVLEKPHRPAELLEIDINRLRRAIAEIKQLRAAKDDLT